MYFHFCFEKVVQEYENKNHQTVFEINLTALVKNLNYLRSKFNLHKFQEFQILPGGTQNLKPKIPKLFKKSRARCRKW